MLIKEDIEELKRRPTAQETFAIAMNDPMEKVQNRLEELALHEKV